MLGLSCAYLPRGVLTSIGVGDAELHFVGRALPHLLLRDRLVGVVQAVRFEEAEAPVEQRLRIHGALVLAGRTHDDRNQALVAALGRGHQAVTRAAVVAGLDAVDRRVAPQQAGCGCAA